MGIHWFRHPNKLICRNLLNYSMTADRQGILDVDALYPNLVPPEATRLMITMERGFLQVPSGGSGCVSLRIMPFGYDLTNPLDIAKSQQWVINGMGLDVTAHHIGLPVEPDLRKFFYALQSTCPSEANKMIIVDLWGYET